MDKKLIQKCLFPVAGYGTRFLPATKSMPKEMLPIVNKPLVQYGVEEAIQAGMRLNQLKVLKIKLQKRYITSFTNK